MIKLWLWVLTYLRLCKSLLINVLRRILTHWRLYKSWLMHALRWRYLEALVLILWLHRICINLLRWLEILIHHDWLSLRNILICHNRHSHSRHSMSELSPLILCSCKIILLCNLSHLYSLRHDCYLWFKSMNYKQFSSITTLV